MKRTYLALLGIFFIGMACIILFASSPPKYGNSLDAMEAVIERQDNVRAKADGAELVIYDLLVKDEYKIAAFTKVGEPVPFHAFFGYAVFQADEDGNYVFRTAHTRTSDRPDILVDIVSISAAEYVLVLCNQPDLTAAKRIVAQTGEETYIEIGDGHAMTLMEQPDLAEISAYYCVYDRDGKVIE